MPRQVVFVVGAGRCGLQSMVHVLNQQPGAAVTLRDAPMLPWRPPAGRDPMAARIRRLLDRRAEPIVGDAAPSYLNHLEAAIAADPGVRILGLKRDCEEVVSSYCNWLDDRFPLPMNHWAKDPAPGWHHDPVWTPSFPQYDTQDRTQGLRRYWRDYYQRLDALAARHPANIRVYDAARVLDDEAVLRDALAFAGVPPERLVVKTGVRLSPARPEPPRPLARRTSNHPLDPGRCVVLVPYSGSILPPCEQALQELERRGYTVRRVGGYAAIDQARCQMATDAMIDGFEETMWIDSDVEFHPDAVDQLRAHHVPIVCGIYPQKGRRALACHILPGTPSMVFGREGGLTEILYAGTGFLLVRREVYLAMQQRLGLPIVNERFGVPMLPYFLPMLHPIEESHWYLAEDYAFCQRARDCGFRIHADTSIRLWHIGSYTYGWEDAGIDRDRNDTFTLHFPDQLQPSRPDAPEDGAEPRE